MLICLMSCLHVIVHVLLYSDTVVTSNSLSLSYFVRYLLELGHLLQGIEVDLSKALNMIDCVILSLIEMPFGIF